MQTSFTVVISFVFSSWIINEFENEFSGTIQLLDNFADHAFMCSFCKKKNCINNYLRNETMETKNI